MNRIAAIVLVLTCTTVGVAFAQINDASPASAAHNPVSYSETSIPAGWREIIALNGVLSFKAPKNVLIVPFNHKYQGPHFQADGLQVVFWFGEDQLLEGEGTVIDGRPAQIREYQDFIAVFFPEVTKPMPGGVGEIKGLRLNVQHQGKPEEAAAIVSSIRFSKAGNAVEKAAQAQADSFRKWKRVAAGEILTFDAPPGLQLHESTASDATRYRFRAPGFEVDIEMRKIARPPAEYAGKEVAHTRFRLDEYWLEVYVKPGRMIAYFQKSLSATTSEGPVIEVRFDDFAAQEKAVALLQTVRLHYRTAPKVSAATPVPSLGGASAEEQLFFAIAFAAVDESLTTFGAKGATVKYEGDSVVVTFPTFIPPDFFGPEHAARVWIDRASGTVTRILLGG